MAAAGAGRTIVFSHANGFPAGTYRLLFEAWRDAGCTVLAIDKIGHDPQHRVSSNWPRLRDQLVAFAEREAAGSKVHFVGHSLGGFLSLLAACRRPAIAQSVVMLDSPVVAGWRAHGLYLAKLLGLTEKRGPAQLSRRRRWQWPSVEDASAHFAAKHKFARWQPQMLADYIAAGTVAEAAGGVRLAFDRDIETRIYGTLPHNLPAVLRRHPPQCPVGYIGGTQSLEGRQAGFSATRRLVGERVTWIDGSHLFPMEKPLQTAAAVLAMLPG